MEQEPLIYCPIQDKFIKVDRSFSIGCLTVKGAAATTWTSPVEARALDKASYDNERGIEIVRRVWKHGHPMAENHVPPELVQEISRTLIVRSGGRNILYCRTFEYKEFVHNSYGMGFMDAEEENKLDVYFSSIAHQKRQSSPNRKQEKGGKVI